MESRGKPAWQAFQIAETKARAKKKEGRGEGEERGNLFLPPLPFHSLFLLSSPLSRRALSEPLAMQARREVRTVMYSQF